MMVELVSVEKFMELFPVPTDKSSIISSMRLVDNSGESIKNEIIIDEKSMKIKMTNDEVIMTNDEVINNETIATNEKNVFSKLLNTIRDLADDGLINNSTNK